MDSRVYGPYRCGFTFHKGEEVVGTVDLKSESFKTSWN